MILQSLPWTSNKVVVLTALVDAIVEVVLTKMEVIFAPAIKKYEYIVHTFI